MTALRTAPTLEMQPPSSLRSLPCGLHAAKRLAATRERAGARSALLRPPEGAECRGSKSAGADLDGTKARSVSRRALSTSGRPSGTEMAARVAYVMNAFPRLSETFIAHEIHQLERLGLPLRLFAVKREPEPFVHAVVAAIRAPLQHLPEVSSLSGSSLPRWLWHNLPAYWRDHASLLRTRPAAWLGTAASALQLAWVHRSRGAWGLPKLRKVFIKEFLQAGHIAAQVLRAPDVGHLHGHFCHGVATITWLASRLSGLPYSFTAHAKDIYQAELNPGDLLERKLGAARFVATCTCANAGVLQARHPRPAEVHTIYHGLDTDWFSPAPKPVPTEGVPPLILAVGRLVEKKGFYQLIEACARLQQAGVRFRCLIVGEHGPAHAQIVRLIEAGDLAEVVELRGAVPQDQLREIYRGAHAFALPCQVMEDGDRDGFPNVLAEAMAMGVPVVSTRISGIPEMIDDGVHGLLVEPRNASALAAALQRVLSDSQLHRHLAQAARARICERFDSRRTTVTLHELFEAELQSRRAARASALMPFGDGVGT